MMLEEIKSGERKYYVDMIQLINEVESINKQPSPFFAKKREATPAFANRKVAKKEHGEFEGIGDVYAELVKVEITKGKTHE